MDQYLNCINHGSIDRNRAAYEIAISLDNVCIPKHKRLTFISMNYINDCEHSFTFDSVFLRKIGAITLKMNNDFSSKFSRFVFRQFVGSRPANNKEIGKATNFV